MSPAPPITIVDAFASHPFSGNPAAVCVLPRETSATWMQRVAEEMNLSETAFLVPEPGGDYQLRWFTPVVEVDLCGHATLASAHVLWESGRLDRSTAARFSTRSGTLTATLGDDGWITLDFPAQPCAADASLSIDSVAQALGLGSSTEIIATAKSRTDLLVEVGSAEVVRSLRPDFEQVARIAVRGLIVTSRTDSGSGSPRSDFTSRFFAPQVGINEDPVTGSAHCVLGPYWASKLGRTTLVGHQASRRGGVVRVQVDGDRVLLGGQAITVVRGELATPVEDFSPNPSEISEK